VLSASDPALPSGEPPRPVCQRCGRSVDEGAIGAQVGLCHCMVCEVYGCRWCWADADGTCPSCGVRYAPAALLAVGPADDPGVATAVVTSAVVAGAGGPPTGRRPDIRAPLAIGTLVVALALLGLAFGGPLGSSAGSTEATPTPAVAVVASAASDATGPPSAGQSGDAIASHDPSSVPTSTDGATPDSTATTDSATPEPLTAPPTASPAVTPAPTPRPTATPERTPSPTPRPTPTPDPTPSCKVVPNLVGSTVQAARTAWTAAGFTGALSPLGHNAAIVTKQNQSVGACLPASTTVTVEYVKAP
jgi:hypothetical protein